MGINWETDRSRLYLVATNINCVLIIACSMVLNLKSNSNNSNVIWLIHMCWQVDCCFVWITKLVCELQTINQTGCCNCFTVVWLVSAICCIMLECSSANDKLSWQHSGNNVPVKTAGIFKHVTVSMKIAVWRCQCYLTALLTATYHLPTRLCSSCCKEVPCVAALMNHMCLLQFSQNF